MPREKFGMFGTHQNIVNCCSKYPLIGIETDQLEA